MVQVSLKIQKKNKKMDSLYLHVRQLTLKRGNGEPKGNNLKDAKVGRRVMMGHKRHFFIPRRPEKTREDPKRPEKTRKDPKRPEKTHLFIPRRPEKTHLFIPRRPEKTREDPKDPKRPEKTPEKTQKDPKRHFYC